MQPDKILFLTNFHWNLIGDDEVQNGYNMIAKSILSLPDCRFVISPHPAELGSKSFINMVRRLDEKGASNYAVVRPSNTSERFEMLRETKLAISTISTILLDLEMWRIPTYLFDLNCYDGLWGGFDDYMAIGDEIQIVSRIKAAMYSDVLPSFNSGKLQRFDASKMSKKIGAKLAKTPMDHSAYIPLVHKYLQQVS